MDLMGRHNVLNLSGMFMYKDIELVDFCIEHGCLTYLKEMNRAKNRCIYPAEWCVNEKIGYLEVNEYFKNHVVEDGAQDIRGYLDFLQLKHYDLDEIIKRNNGGYSVNFYWVRFKGYGAQTYKEMQEFIPPLII